MAEDWSPTLTLFSQSVRRPALDRETVIFVRRVGREKDESE